MKLTKKEVDIYNKVAKQLNDTRDVAPCIRINPDGSTSIINCKTGEVIPPKKD